MLKRKGDTSQQEKEHAIQREAGRSTDPGIEMVTPWKTRSRVPENATLHDPRKLAPEVVKLSTTDAEIA